MTLKKKGDVQIRKKSSPSLQRFRSALKDEGCPSGRTANADIVLCVLTENSGIGGSTGGGFNDYKSLTVSQQASQTVFISAEIFHSSAPQEQKALTL